MLGFQKQWQSIISSGAFSQKVHFKTEGGREFDVNGLFSSGTYGESDEGRYIRKKALKAQFLEISELSLRDIGVSKDELLRATVTIGRYGDYDAPDAETLTFMVYRLMGNDSDVIDMELS